MVLTRVTFFMSGINLQEQVRVRLYNSIELTDSFSLLALFLPNFSQSWSNVASSLACSLIRQCHGAPSSGPLGRCRVFTFLWYVFPTFQDEVESRRASADAMMASSAGISRDQNKNVR